MSETIQTSLTTLLDQLAASTSLDDTRLLVIGCSTSEVVGEAIGTSSTMDVAASIFSSLEAFQQQTGVKLAFQSCEHLNRALVVERETAQRYGYEKVSAVPVRSAGGAMATYAYHHFNDPVLVEFVKADAGIDIGDTFIGMHLKHVAVPVRSEVKTIGEAHVTMARTRPKLIGGERAVYDTREEATCNI